jgi:hypothetical protein
MTGDLTAESAGISSRIYRPVYHPPRESIPAAWDGGSLKKLGFCWLTEGQSYFTNEISTPGVNCPNRSVIALK